MGFGLSVGGFFSFLTRPFTNPVGWILLIAAAVWIWARLSGKVGGLRRGRERQGGSQADYIIK